MAREEIKLKEEAISEILVTETDLVSGAEANDVGDYFKEEEEEGEEEGEEEEEEEEPQAATSGGLPTRGLPQGRNTNIHAFFGPANGVKKSESPHINTDSSQLTAVCVYVFHRNFSSAGGTDQRILLATL